jgi:hypothetical protein
MKFYQKYYIVESGFLLDIADSYRKDFLEAKERIFEYVKGLGGETYKLGIRDQLYAIGFPKRIQPKDFKRPDSDGCCQPYVRSKLNDDFKEYSLPSCVKPLKLALGFPDSLSYKTGTGKGSVCIGHPFRPAGFYWYNADSPLLLSIPDVDAYAKNIAKGRGDIIFTGDQHTWKLDDNGCREIIVEEWDLMVAKHKQKIIEEEAA